MQRHFDQELEKLRERLLRMAGIIETMTEACRAAIRRGDDQELGTVFELEQTANQLHLELFEAVVLLIARHQPVADDLRLLIAALGIIGNLERMGDLSVNLARKLMDLVPTSNLSPLLNRLMTMLETVQETVVDAVEAFVRQDPSAAEAVLRADDIVDSARDEIARTVVESIVADRGQACDLIELLLASRNIERIADHATNVAQDVLYLVRGRDLRHRVGESHEAPGSWRQVRNIPAQPQPMDSNPL